MVYKKYIKKGGKTFGPYYYESYRDKDGKVRTRFISGPTKKDRVSRKFVRKTRKERKRKKQRSIPYEKLSLALIIIFAVLFLLSIGNWNYSRTTGMAVYEKEITSNNIKLAKQIAKGELVSNVDIRKNVNLKIEKPSYEKNKVMEFKVPDGEITLDFDLMDYGKFVKNDEREEVEAEGFDIGVEESEEKYKWGYNVKLKDMQFMAKIDITTDKDIVIIDRNTLRIGESYLSFADLAEEGYVVSMGEPVVLEEIVPEEIILEAAEENITEIIIESVENNVILHEENTTKVNVTGELLEENITETIVPETNITEENTTQENVEQPISEEPVSLVTGFVINGLRGITQITGMAVKQENTISVYIEKDFTNIRQVGEAINLDPILIIIVTKAKHLDEDMAFLSDIYSEVFQRDDVWSEEISEGEYVRATFQQSLTNENDITIYPRVVSGNPRIEVYEQGGNTVIAEFTSLISNQYNKALLTNLQNSQNTFDLRILGGTIELDHIVDPLAYNGTTVYQCGIINASGTYIMNQSITNDTLMTHCINITVQDVTLDCAGYSITSISNFSGIFSNEQNTTIRNCNISMGPLGSGIEMGDVLSADVGGSYIYNTTLNNQYNGLFMYGLGEPVKDVLIEEVTANSNTQGIYLSQASNISIRNTVLNSNTDGIYIDSSLFNNSIIDSNISSLTTDIDFRCIPGGGLDLLNTTYDVSKEDVDSGCILRRKWLYQAYVNDANGNAVAGANVSVYNRVRTLVQNLTTNSSGWTNITNVTEYTNTGGSRSYDSPYTFWAMNSSVNVGYSQHNFTAERSVLNSTITLDSSVDSCVFLPFSGVTYNQSANIVQAAPLCIWLYVPNITFDCQGYDISSEVNYSGIYSNQENITIKNCNVSMGPGSRGYGIHLQSATNAIILNSTLNSQEIGLYLNYSNNVTASGIIANSNDFGMVSGSSDYLIVNDSVFSGTVNDFRFDGDSKGNIFLNVSYNISKGNVTARCNLTRKGYFLGRVNVTALGTGAALSGANVSVRNTTTSVLANNVTGSNGQTTFDRTQVFDFYKDVGTTRTSLLDTLRTTRASYTPVTTPLTFTTLLDNNANIEDKIDVQMSNFYTVSTTLAVPQVYTEISTEGSFANVSNASAGRPCHYIANVSMNITGTLIIEGCILEVQSVTGALRTISVSNGGSLIMNYSNMTAFSKTGLRNYNFYGLQGSNLTLKNSYVNYIGTANTDYLRGLVINSSNLVFDNITMTLNSRALTLRAPNLTISNSRISGSSSGGPTGYGDNIRIMAQGSRIVNCNVSDPASGKGDIALDAGISTTVINTNYSLVGFSTTSTSTLTRQWTLDITALYGNGTAATNANITAYNASGDAFSSVLVGSSGVVGFNLTEYVQNASGDRFYYTPYSINETKAGFLNSSSSLNITVPSSLSFTLLKPNGVACIVNADCNSGYCNSDYLCDNAPSTPGGDTGGGGGGGGDSVSVYALTTEQFLEGYTKELSIGDRLKFIVDEEIYYITLKALTSTAARINVTGESQQIIVSLGQERKFELTGDDAFDASLMLNNISFTAGKAVFTLKSIHEQVTEKEIGGEEKPKGKPLGELAEETLTTIIGGQIDYFGYAILGLIGGIILVSIVLFYLFIKFRRIKKKEKVVEKEEPKEKPKGKLEVVVERKKPEKKVVEKKPVMKKIIVRKVIVKKSEEKVEEKPKPKPKPVESEPAKKTPKIELPSEE